MDYSDSDNEFLEMYSEDEQVHYSQKINLNWFLRVTPVDSDGEHFMNVLHRQTNKCKSWGNVTFSNINGVMVWKVCKTIINNHNREQIDFDTMLQAKHNKVRVNKVKMKVSSNEITPVGNKVFPKDKRFLDVNPVDWTMSRLLANHKTVTMPEVWWVDYFLSIHFGILMWAKQMRHWLNLDKEFEQSVKRLWIKYLGCWKDMALIGTFTSERSGGLKIDKRTQIKRFELFTQKQLENYTEWLKSTPKADKEIIANKEYLNRIKDTYYQLRYNKELWWVKRKQKEISKNELDTLEFLKNNTMWYNDRIYSKFKSAQDVFNLKIYPELNLRSRSMIYLQMWYPLSNLAKFDTINPINLLRNIKYRSGKLLNIDDRTYTVPVLSGIASNWLAKLNLNIDINLSKFVSSRMKKKDKLLLLIFTLDLIMHEYSNASPEMTNPIEIIKFLKSQVQSSLCKDYIQTISNESEAEWWTLIAHKETKKMSFEKLLSKFIKYYYDFGTGTFGNFKKEISSIKKSKLYNSNNRLISIEPNLILTFLILGYYEYQTKSNDEEWHDINDIIKAINLGKIQYLTYSQVYSNKIRGLKKHYLLQVKHLANSAGIWKSLKYLLPSSLNNRIKPFIFRLLDKTCSELGIWEEIKTIAKKYLCMQYPLTANKVMFPFNAETFVFECISYIYSLIYSSGVSLDDVNKAIMTQNEKESIEAENTPEHNGKIFNRPSLNITSLPSKNAFNSNVNLKEAETRLVQTQSSIPWEIKDFEICSEYSIMKILTATENYHKQSELENEQRTNNDTKTIAEIFDDIFSFEDEVILESEESSSSENSSIKSSDEESEISSECNIIEIAFSTSWL